MHTTNGVQLTRYCTPLQAGAITVQGGRLHRFSKALLLDDTDSEVVVAIARWGGFLSPSRSRLRWHHPTVVPIALTAIRTLRIQVLEALIGKSPTFSCQ